MELAMPFVRQILTKFVKQAGPDEVRKRMTKAVPKIVAGMRAKGMTPQAAQIELVIRDALFRLWRSVIPSGDLADLIRDAQDDKVIPMAIARIVDKGDLTAIVKGTMDAVIELTF